MKKERWCLVLSPSEMNGALGTAIIAPLTTTLRGYPSRIEIRFENKFCEICLDQIRAVDDSRIQKESRGRISSGDVEKSKLDWLKCSICNTSSKSLRLLVDICNVDRIEEIV